MSTQQTELVSFYEAVSEYDLAAEIDDLLDLLKTHPKVQALEKERGSLGGYLCVARVEDGTPLGIIQFGRMPEDKLAGRLAFSQEKVRCLADNANHMTSFESRDPDQNKWGGAIRGDSRLYGASGLPEPLDELFGALFAINIGDLSVKAARAFLEANGNEYYEELKDLEHELWSDEF